MSEKTPIEPVNDILREAGTIVMRLQDEIVRTPKKRQMKQDGSFVTDADIRSLEFIAKKLRALTPGIPIVAEEQPADVNKTILEGGKTFWLVDSLDNTGDYALGGNNFSINVALIGSDGLSKMGVLFFPGLGELYYTGDDGRAYKQDGKAAAQAIRVIPFNAAVSEEIMKVAHHPQRASGLSFFLGQKLRFITTRGQRRACLVATGEVALCVENEGYYIWDTAPVSAILKAAGGGVFNLEDGEALSFNKGLRLPAYAAAAAREIPFKMGLFGLHGVMGIPPADSTLLRKSSGA
jgi:3'-phosphoadenosine 5'-phosphosulfate (PAPS) 3'-phosphatase